MYFFSSKITLFTGIKKKQVPAHFGEGDSEGSIVLPRLD